MRNNGEDMKPETNETRQICARCGAIAMYPEDRRNGHCQYCGEIEVVTQKYIPEEGWITWPEHRYIPNWDKLNLKCNICGTTKSVKYQLANGQTICNLCALKEKVCS
jgi:hypothetical protein